MSDYIRPLAILAGLFLILVVCTSWTANERAPECTGAFPFSEGSPWRVLEVSTKEMTDVLWLIGENPYLAFRGYAHEAVGCHTVAWEDTSAGFNASGELMEFLTELRAKR